MGRLWGHLDRFPLRRLVVAEERPGTLGGGLDVVAVRGEAAPTPQAHRTAPYRPRYSPDQRTAGQSRWRARHPRRGMCSQIRAPLPAWRRPGRVGLDPGVPAIPGRHCGCHPRGGSHTQLCSRGGASRAVRRSLFSDIFIPCTK